MGAHQSAAAGALRTLECTTRASALSLDDPRFESLLLRLHASVDVREFWGALLWILDESAIALRRAAERGDFTGAEMALLQRLHPHLQTVLQRLSALRRTRDAMDVLPSALTTAERELVRFVRIGFSNKEIAARLDKSVRTVKTQLTSVYKKCGVRSRSRLLAMMMPRLSYD